MADVIVNTLKSEDGKTDNDQTLIGIATHAFETVDFEVHFNHLFVLMQWAKKYKLVLLGIGGLQAAKAREIIVEQAVATKCTHVLFIDADHFIPEQMLEYLLENKDEAIVSGLVNKKGEGYPQIGWLRRPQDQKYLNIDLPLDGKLYEVGVCAFGCTLINLKCLQEVRKPYFRDTCEPDGSGSFTNIRSDVNVCNLLREKGHKVWIDTRILIGHQLGKKRIVYPQSAETLRLLDGLEKEARKLKAEQTGAFYLVDPL